MFVWDARGDGSVQSWDTEKGNVLCAAFTPDGENLVAASAKNVYVFAADSGANRAVFAGTSAAVNAIAVGPNSRWVAVGYANGLIRVYDLDTKAPIATLSGHAAGVVDLAFSPDGRWVASASGDGSARVWDVATGNTVFHLRGHTGPVTGVAFRPDGYELITAGMDGTVRGWNLVVGNEPLGLFRDGLVTATAGATAARRLAWATTNGPPQGPHTYHVTVFDFDRGEGVLDVPKLTSRVMGLTLSADGRRLAIGQMNGDATVYEIGVPGPGQRFGTGIFAVSSLAFSPDGTTLACAGALPRTLLIDLPGKKLKAQLIGHKGSNTAVAYRPDGTELATGGYDGTIRVWTAATGGPIRALEGHQGPVTSVAYRPDGKMLASCGTDGKIRLWDATTGAPLRTLEGHAGEVGQVLFTPDGARLFSAGADRALRCWDPDSGDVLLRLAGVLGSQDRLTWVGGDGCLASGAQLEAVRLWQKAPFALGAALTAQKQITWHNEAWGAAMLDRNWFTMDHHLSRLIPQFGAQHPGLYDQRGRARLALGRVNDALADFSTAIEKGYADPAALRHTADAHVIARNWDKAAAALSKLAERRPDDPDTMYRRGALAAYNSGPADARAHQRALRRAAVGGAGEVRLFSLWLDAVVPDPGADTETRLAEAAKLLEQDPRHRFTRATYALWLYRADRLKEAAAEAEKAVAGEGSEAKAVAAAVFILVARKLGREDAAKRAREDLEALRNRLRRADAEEWIALGDPEEWPTYLSFLLLTDEFDRGGRPAPPPIPPAK